MSDMTPREAADVIERTTWSDASLDRPLRVLIDHARATSPAPEGGDLAHRALDVARALYADARGGPDGPLDLDEVSADLSRLGREITAPAPSVATPPQEGVAPMDPADECTCGHDYATHVVNEGSCLHAKVCACAGFDLAPAAPPAEGEAASGEPLPLLPHNLLPEDEQAPRRVDQVAWALRVSRIAAAHRPSDELPKPLEVLADEVRRLRDASPAPSVAAPPRGERAGERLEKLHDALAAPGTVRDPEGPR